MLDWRRFAGMSDGLVLGLECKEFGFGDVDERDEVAH